MTRSNIIDIEVELHHRTERAALVSLDGDRERAVWLPLSQIEIEVLPGPLSIVSLPERLAIDKGLV